MRDTVLERFRASAELKLAVREGFAPLVLQAVAVVCERLRRGGTVFLCGNGGSAADAQHLAGELEGRFAYDRPPLRAVCLNCNVSTLTAIGNDYAFDAVFSRPLEALAGPDDVLIGLSTSGNSPNVVAALKVARSRGAFCIAFTGDGGGAMAEWSDILFAVPCRETPRVQEVHITAGHILCELIERGMFPPG